jgi:threonine dehydratase
VKEVTHDRNFAPPDVGSVQVICVLETRDAQHIQQVEEALKSAGVEFRDASKSIWDVV